MSVITMLSIDHIKEIIKRTIALADRSALAEQLQMEELRSKHNDNSHMIALCDIPEPPHEYHDLTCYLSSLSDLELQVLMHAMIEGRYVLEGYRTVCPLKDLQKESEPVYSHSSAVEYVAGKRPLAKYLRTYLRTAETQAKLA